MRDWREQTHQFSFHMYLELWIPKSLDSCKNIWNTKKEPVLSTVATCCAVRDKLQHKLQDTKILVIGNLSCPSSLGLTSGREVVRAGVERGSSQAGSGSREANWQEAMGQNGLCKDQGAKQKTNTRKDTGCVQGDLPRWQLRGEATKGKRRKQKSPFPLNPHPFSH